MLLDIDRVISTDKQDSISSNVLAPYLYLAQLAGNNNNMRYRFLVAFNMRFFKIDNTQVLSEIGDIIAIFHNASLLIDDIEDSLELRRGHPCAHTKYGVPLTINSGNLMYFVALQRAITALPNLWLELQEQKGIGYGQSGTDLTVVNPSVIECKTNRILVDEMLNLHQGQGLDIYWRDSLHEIMENLPTIEEYLSMVMNKTGGLFRLSVKLLALFSPSPLQVETLIPLANLLGIIYQIRDDYLNLIDERYFGMKGVAGEDLIEGKLSLPVLHCLLHNEEKSALHYVLLDLKTSEDRKNDPDSIAKAILFIKESGSLKFTYDLLQEYVSKALRMLGSFPEPDDACKLREIVVLFSNVMEP